MRPQQFKRFDIKAIVWKTGEIIEVFLRTWWKADLKALKA